MSHLGIALLLLIAVIAVSVATRPAPRRRRPAPGPRIARDAEPEPGPAGPAEEFARQSRLPGTTDRNRWDRRDLVLGIGRDFATPDPRLMLWPESGPFAR